jgi:hypothetical protein
MKIMKKICTVYPLMIGLFTGTSAVLAEQQTRVDTNTGAESWEIHHQGVSFSLTQILPEQVQAFYVNRGFTLDQIEPFTRSCVYMTVLRNDNAAGSIHFVRNNWSIQVHGKTHPLVPVNDWLQRFK